MTQPLSRTRVAIARLYREHPAKFWLRVSVVTLAVILFVVKRNFWTPDTLFVVLLVLAVAFGKARPFLVRFVPFIGLLLVYDSFRGIADELNKSVHFTEMIVADRALFGGDANACIGRISPGLSSWALADS